MVNVEKLAEQICSYWNEAIVLVNPAGSDLLNGKTQREVLGQSIRIIKFLFRDKPEAEIDNELIRLKSLINKEKIQALVEKNS